MLRLVSIMLFFNVTDEHLMLFARLKAGTSSNMRLESIVMHVQGPLQFACIVISSACCHVPSPFLCAVELAAVVLFLTG